MSVPRLGLIVNPIAGIGGAVGLKGSDGEEAIRDAIARGAVPLSNARATIALSDLAARWPSPIQLVTVAAPMGEEAARSAGFDPRLVDLVIGTKTTAGDTRRAAGAMAAIPVDLILFAGGDGTARDMATAVGDRVPVLGIPTGVKMNSAVFATSPRAAAAIVADFLSNGAVETAEREVLDLDEDAYRRGEMAPRLFGYLRVPASRSVQDAKAPSAPSDDDAAAAIAADVVDRMQPGTRYVLGPGTTVRAIADELGAKKTLVGVDVVSDRALVASDIAGEQLTRLVTGAPAVLIVTPIGGQGFLFGRGSQPIGAAAIRAIGKKNIVVVATPTKLAGLGGRPLLVDTGDPELDRELAGYVEIVTGYRECMIYEVRAA